MRKQFNLTQLSRDAIYLLKEETPVTPDTKEQARVVLADLIDLRDTARDNITNPRASKILIGVAITLTSSKLNAKVPELIKKYGLGTSYWTIGLGVFTVASLAAKAISVLYS